MLLSEANRIVCGKTSNDVVPFGHRILGCKVCAGINFENCYQLWSAQSPAATIGSYEPRSNTLMTFSKGLKDETMKEQSTLAEGTQD